VDSGVLLLSERDSYFWVGAVGGEEALVLVFLVCLWWDGVTALGAPGFWRQGESLLPGHPCPKITLASATGSWGTVRNSSVLPSQEESPVMGEERSLLLLAAPIKLVWSFCLNELGAWREGQVQSWCLV
jgi:hypothetical protein